VTNISRCFKVQLELLVPVHRGFPGKLEKKTLNWCVCVCVTSSMFSFMVQQTHTLLYGSLDFVQDYPREPVPEPIWILLEQETENGSGISWAIPKSAPRPRQITMPAPDYSVLVQEL